MKKLLFIGLLFCVGISFSQVTANQPSPIILCDATNPGDGIEVFDLTIREDEILNGQTNVTISYHNTSGDALGNGGFIADPENYTNVSNPELIFIRAQGAGDFDITSMEISVSLSAVADTFPENIFIDEGDADDQAIFDLTINEALMLGDQSPEDYTFTYYLNQADCETQAFAIAQPTMFENTENPQEIFVRFTSLVDGCGTCYNFQIETDTALSIENVILNSLRVYPNPVNDLINVELNSEAFAKIFIRDIQGRIIKTLEGRWDSQSIAVSVLENGVYFLTVEANGVRHTKRFVKE